MAEAAKRIWAVTALSGKDVLYLRVDDERYEVAQFTMSFACNEIPQAQCMVAVGRDARDGVTPASVHHSGKSLRSMQKARVTFTPEGDYNPDGVPWPKGSFEIFDGYFVGSSYRKVNGKTVMIFNLVHWLLDLACSSTLSQNSHPSNPGQMTAASVLRSFDQAGAGGDTPAFVSNLVGWQTVRESVQTDLWGGIKNIFCGLANVPARPAGPLNVCTAAGDIGSTVVNTRAINALARMEGPSDGDPDPDDPAADGTPCSRDYAYGVPLSLDTAGVLLVQDGVAKAITDEMVMAYANTTFWDKLVGEFCPMFGMAVVPLVDTAVVIADCPSYNRDFWKELAPDDYDGLDQDTILERPLRAVGVMGVLGSTTGATEGKVTNPSFVGGCYVAGSVDEDDGVVQFVSPPKWLECMKTEGANSLANLGLAEDVPIQCATTIDPAADPDDPDVPRYNEFATLLNGLYVKYAQTVYVTNMLRGRIGSVSGRLRFDIAPGSCIKLRARAEKFLAGEDDLAVDIFANVARVTVSINCDAGIAGTSFQLSHIRTAEENTSPRTSTSEHPLFGRQIHGAGTHGAPLMPEFDGLET